MQLNKKQFEILMELRNIAFTHKDDFTSSEIGIVNMANQVLEEVFDKNVKSNKKVAEYIANKRLTNKNYARSK